MKNAFFTFSFNYMTSGPFYSRVIVLGLYLLLQHSLYAQQYEDIRMDRGEASIELFPELKTVQGSITYSLSVLRKVDSVYIDAQQMQIDSVILDNQRHAFEYDSTRVIVRSNFQPGESHKATFYYTAKPKQALYFIDWDVPGGTPQIWTQGQGKYTSHWLPSFDDMRQKTVFDISVRFDSAYEVVANGILQSKEKISDGKTEWRYTMQKPMSSYLVALAAGPFWHAKQISESKVPLLQYYLPQDSLNVEPTYRHSLQLFNFLEKEIGVPFPWQVYKQIPVKDFLYAGMENTTLTLFSDRFVVDSVGFTDRNYINVNAHELAHQWFGNLVTETEGTHHWLQEGFATYYALLAEKQIFGDDYFYFKLYESAEQLEAVNRREASTSLLDPKASSLTFYQRGAWVLFALREKIGDKAFREVIRTYLKKYQHKNVTTDDFFGVVKEITGEETDTFQKKWLIQPNFPSASALALLEKVPFIKKYLTLAKERTQPLAGKREALLEHLDFPVNSYLSQEVIYQLQNEVTVRVFDVYKKAFDTNDVLTRQAIALTVAQIPSELRKEFESLLDDPSYVTQEAALYHLWSSFPQYQKKYLDKMKTRTGFSDRNIRMLWMALALNTSNYLKDKEEVLRELIGFTSPKFAYGTRENAFNYLNNLGVWTDSGLRNLADACVHHNWRFRSASRKILDTLLKKNTYQKKYVVLYKQLRPNVQRYLRDKITPKNE